MGADSTKPASFDPGATQVVDLRDVHLSDVNLADLDTSAAHDEGPRRTAPPPLPVLPPVEVPPTFAPMPASTGPATHHASLPPRGRSTGFYVGVLVAFLMASVVVGFVLARALRGNAPSSEPTSTSASPASPPGPAAPAASGAPAGSASARVITISPVEVE